MSVNANGLPSAHEKQAGAVALFKAKRLRTLCASTRAAILCVSETHFAHNDKLDNHLLPGYTQITQSAPKADYRRGGVLIATAPEICAEPIELPQLASADVCAAKIFTGDDESQHVVVVNAYVRPGVAETRNAATELPTLMQCFSPSAPVIWAGDYNPSGWDFEDFLDATGAFELNDIYAATFVRSDVATTPDRLMLVNRGPIDLLPDFDSSTDDDAATNYRRKHPARVVCSPLVSDHAALLWEIPLPSAQGPSDAWFEKTQEMTDHDWRLADDDAANRLVKIDVRNDADAEKCLQYLVKSVKAALSAFRTQVRPRGALGSGTSRDERIANDALRQSPEIAAEYAAALHAVPDDGLSTADHEALLAKAQRKRWQAKVANAKNPGDF